MTITEEGMYANISNANNIDILILIWININNDDSCGRANDWVVQCIC